ncbi:hypothetical protein PTTG_09747, partial [Puccinia triticina 1-1 BBBD Race 1]
MPTIPRSPNGQFAPRAPIDETPTSQIPGQFGPPSNSSRRSSRRSRRGDDEDSYDDEQLEYQDQDPAINGEEINDSPDDHDRPEPPPRPETNSLPAPNPAVAAPVSNESLAQAIQLLATIVGRGALPAVVPEP